MICTKRFRRQLLRLFDHRYRMAEIVQRFHGIHIQTDTFFPQKFHQFRIPPPSLMSGHIEGNDPSFLQFFQRLIDRRMHLFFLIHIFSLLSFSPSTNQMLFIHEKRTGDITCPHCHSIVLLCIFSTSAKTMFSEFVVGIFASKYLLLRNCICPQPQANYSLLTISQVIPQPDLFTFFFRLETYKI